jgi:hypothetical protein
LSVAQCPGVGDEVDLGFAAAWEDQGPVGVDFVGEILART